MLFREIGDLRLGYREEFPRLVRESPHRAMLSTGLKPDKTTSQERFAVGMVFALRRKQRGGVEMQAVSSKSNDLAEDSKPNSWTNAILESLIAEKEEIYRDLNASVLQEVKTPSVSAGEELNEDPPEVYSRREWAEGRLYYINRALESLLDGSHSRCRQCGESLGTGQLTTNSAARLCLICQRNCGLNAKFHTP
jgi:hypothetical protein